MGSKIRTYSEMIQTNSFEERYKYLVLRGNVGETTFGFDRFLNQQFYRSTEWRHIRHHVIARDLGCDLGVSDYEIYSNLFIHHMNPLTPQEIINGSEEIIDPEFLITTSLKTHNAIHYGDERHIPKPYVERRHGDTKLW